MKQSRSAFLLTEMALALALMGVLMWGFMKYKGNADDDAMVKQEYLNAYRFEAGLKNSMVAILDTFEPVCGNIGNDTVVSMAWGWGNAVCTGTSPLPVKSGNNIVYSINFGSLPSAAAQAALKNKIASSFAPMCKVASSNATSLSLFCGSNIVSFQYDTSAGLVNTFHTPGTNFNHLETPVPVLTLRRQYTQGDVTENKTYRLQLQDVFDMRTSYSTEKMQNVGKMLKNVYNLKLAQETSNTAPTGLNSIDDEYTPWFWVAFGDNAGLAGTTSCSKNTSTGVCDNLNTPNIWRSTVGDSLLWRKLIAGYAGGDYKYTVDGFGNALRIYPMLSQCNGLTDLSLCSVTAPAVPREPYPISATVKPPYTTVIHSNLSSGSIDCKNLASQAPIGCRYPVVY